ncbi:unnamed protein product [Sphagnum balticum]
MFIEGVSKEEGESACFSIIEDENLMGPVDAPEVLDDLELGDEESVEIKGWRSKLNNSKYRMQSLIIGFIAMATVQSCSHVVFDCKAPDEIWDKVPEYYNFENNMFMNGNRIFVKNPQNGLAIKPFRKAHMNHAATDPRTIGAVTISVQDNLSNLDH